MDIAVRAGSRADGRHCLFICVVSVICRVGGRSHLGPVIDIGRRCGGIARRCSGTGRYRAALRECSVGQQSRVGCEGIVHCSSCGRNCVDRRFGVISRLGR